MRKAAPQLTAQAAAKSPFFEIMMWKYYPLNGTGPDFFSDPLIRSCFNKA
jgi:hypothetical protein